MKRARILLLACALACACTHTVDPTPSTEIPTAQLAFAIVVRSDGRVTQVIVKHFGELTAPDRLYTRTLAGEESTLVAFGGGEWVTQIDSPEPTIVIGLARAGGVRVETAVVLPPSFTLKAPPTTSRTAPIVLEWDAPPAPVTHGVSLEIDGECIQPFRRTLSLDTGTFALQPADFFPVGAPRPCALTVVVHREAPSAASWTGAPAPSASITTEQTRAITFPTTP
jgi:hypothetical protein